MCMISSMLHMLRHIFAMPIGWKIWVGWLMVLNGIMPFFFLPHQEAYAILLLFLLAGLIGGQLFKRYGFTRLMGLMHFVWFPLIFFLDARLAFIPIGSCLSIWIHLTLLCNQCSLVIDVIDVSRYALGERGVQIVLEDEGQMSSYPP
ncbi:MAG: hypothetical protein GY801_12455 [bacterium]|nr:hypothetical protein [bacterium]